MAQTLAELKAENAKSEDDTNTTPQVVSDDAEDDAVELELDNVDVVAEPESTDDDATDTEGKAKEQPQIESWMQSEESQDSQSDDKKFTDGDVAAAKRKLRAKLDVKDDELEKLRAKVNDLENNRTTVTGGHVKKAPKREDFDDSNDPESAYIDALTDYKLDQRDAKAAATNAANQSSQKQEAQKKEVSQAVDQHYERAVKLSENSNISADAYKSTDLKVRQMIESVYPNAGDNIADILISNVGEGSEKVFYNIGVNPTKMNILKEHLQNDLSGLKAVAYLSRLTGELNPPLKRKTNAPKPAAQINGDNAGAVKQGKLKKSYEKAHASGNTQEAWNIKRRARKNGADISDW